ncbi:MAG TPA: histidine triad nucleotide-binding protein [Candidatus Limnocylindrales bacterium]
MAVDCLFCRIVSGDVAADVVAQDERVLAFRDINPQAPTHVLVIPREHVASAADLAEHHGDLLAAMFSMANGVAAADGRVETGYRLVFNVGPDAGQSVDHLHLHVLGGRRLAWPPG